MIFSKLSTKLAISMLAAGLLPLFVAGVIVMNLTHSALEERAFAQLESLRSNKAQQIEEYFSEIEKQMLTFSNSIMIVDAMNEFNYSFSHEAGNNSVPELINKHKKSVESFYQNEFAKEYKLRHGNELDVKNIIPKSNQAIYHQYQYISNSELSLGRKDGLNKADSTGLYGVSHEKYHPIIREYQSQFGYSDIYLVEPENGNIVYSVFKDVDYATSLLDGPYKDANIARVFKAARSAQETSVIFVEDFEPYHPSFDAPASFMASPIFNYGQLTGVLIFQMPVDHINSIMSSIEGLGETGQTYLLGSDMIMRNQSRLHEEPTLLVTKVDTEGANKAIAGEVGIGIFDSADGNSLLSAYSPLALNGYDWAIMAEIDENEALSATKKISLMLVELAIVIILCVVALSYFVMKSVSKQLGGDPTDLLKIANDIVNDRLDRNSTKEDDANAKGVYAAMIRMQDTLKESIQTDRRNARKVERIKQALDNVSSCVVVADVDLEIIYTNDKANELFSDLESNFRIDLPSFNANNLVGSPIDVFYKNAGQQRQVFQQMNETLTSDIVIGSQHLRTTANPIVTQEQERIGTVIEWKDLTSEIAVENEVQSLVDSALDGDLSQRISLDNKSGFLSRLSGGINDLVNVSEQVINDTIRVLSAISQGNLNEKIDAEYKGTFNLLKSDANQTIAKLTEIVGKIKGSSTLVSSAADEISKGNMNLSQRTESQAASLEETSASMEEMTSSVKQNADNSKNANELAISAREQAQRSSEVVNEAVNAMEKINNASSKISEIISVIDEIAFQTNLLALNAAVEAARAGEQGRGFAVVASEVRNLAGRSATAAKEIKDLIEDSVDKVQEGSRLVNQSGHTLEKIMSSIKQVTEIVGDITNASSEQATGIEQVNNAIISMDETTQNNAALVEEAAAAAESMNEQSNELMRLVGFFDVGDEIDSVDNLTAQKINNSTDSQHKDNKFPDFSMKKAVGDDFSQDNWEEF